MGEAKMRRDRVAVGAPTPYTDMRAGGAVKWGRQSPSIRRQMVMLQQLLDAIARGERPQAQVPCNGCTSCCHMGKIDFDPAIERPEDLSHLDWEPDPEKPGWALMRRRDGACVHLGPGGRTVYEHRPQCCRVFDCRVYQAAGTTEIYEDGSTWPIWVPEVASEEDRLHLGALNAALMMEIDIATKAGETWGAVSMALRAWRRMPELLPVMRKLKALMAQASPEIQRQLAETAKTETLKALRELQQRSDVVNRLTSEGRG